MKRCDTCKANKVCDHERFGFENCDNYIATDVVPRAQYEDVLDEVDRLMNILDNYALQLDTVKREMASELVSIIDLRLSISVERKKVSITEFGNGLWEGHKEAYQDIREIIKQKYTEENL